MSTAITSIEPGLSRYLREVNRYPLLTEERERALARRWRDHRDIAAAHELVTSHLRFVVKIAMKYRSYGLRAMARFHSGGLWWRIPCGLTARAAIS